MPVTRALKGLTPANIKLISQHNHEPEWLLKKRLINRIAGVAKKCQLDLNNLRVPLADSNVVTSSFSPTQLPKSLTCSDIMRVAQNDEQSFRDHFDKLSSLSQPAMADFNTAFFSNGTFLRVLPDFKFERTITLSSYLNSPRINQFKRNLIILEENSAVKIRNAGEAEYWPAINQSFETTEIFVEKDAVCEFEINQAWHKNVQVFYVLNVRLEENSKFTLRIKNTKASNFALESNILLDGSHAKCQIACNITSYNKQNVTKHIEIQQNSEASELLIKDRVIAKEDSKQSNFYTVDVDSHAEFSKCMLTCTNLIADNGTITCVPIINSHCKTARVNQECDYYALNRDQKYYLETRGFNDEMIEKLMAKNVIQ